MRTLLLLTTALIISTGDFVKAQSAHILEVEDQQVYELISRLQRRGYLLELNPDKLPYTVHEVNGAIWDTDWDNIPLLEKNWMEELNKFVQVYIPESQEEIRLNFQASGGLEVNNTERKDGYRPLRSEVFLWPNLSPGAAVSWNNMVLNANLRFDYYYDRDPDGLDAVNRLYTRNENAYFGLYNKYVKIYAGRFSNHWGFYNQGAAFVSNNPRTFDHLNMQLDVGQFSLSTIYGYLDNIDRFGNYTGDTRDDRDAKRRFVSMKRIDWKPGNRFMISYKESILYSGYRSIPEPKYLLPTHVFAFLADNAPNNDVNNLLFGLSIWGRIQNLTLRGEYLFDDIIFNKDERGISEKNTFSFIANASYAFAKLPVDVNSNVEVISYQSYNTDQAEGRYLYLTKGIATQFNDYVFADLRIDWYADTMVKGLRVSPYAGLLKQGEQEINQPYQDEYPDGTPLEIVLTGIVESTKRVALNLFYSPVSYFWINADAGMNFVNNLDHMEGQGDTRFAASIEVGFRYNFSVNL